MKDFLTQCLIDLEAITGIRQYYFLTVDTDGERKATVLILGILEVCKQFPYISEADQQKIIKDQMIKDQNYDALNSRTVWKWLNGAKDLYWEKAQKPVEEVKPLEPLSEETQQMIRDWQISLLGMDKPKVNFKAEMEKVKLEDELRLQGIPLKSESIHYTPDPKKAIILERKMKAARDRGLDKLDFRELQNFIIEGINVTARNLEEAQEMYIEIYE